MCCVCDACICASSAASACAAACLAALTAAFTRSSVISITFTAFSSTTLISSVKRCRLRGVLDVEDDADAVAAACDGENRRDGNECDGVVDVPVPIRLRS